MLGLLLGTPSIFLKFYSKCVAGFQSIIYRIRSAKPLNKNSQKIPKHQATIPKDLRSFAFGQYRLAELVGGGNGGMGWYIQSQRI